MTPSQAVGPPSGWYDVLVLGQSSGPSPAARPQVRDTSPGSQLSIWGERVSHPVPQASSFRSED